jgi:hypothetical protein
MKKQRQGVRSTRVLAETTDITYVYALPKMKDLYIKIYNATKMINSNQTGRFPATSSRGKKCILVLVEVDGNYIYQRRTNEKQIRRINDKSLPSTVEQTYCIRNSETKDTYNG